MKKSINQRKKILLVIWGGIHYGGVSVLLHNLISHMEHTDLDIDLYAFGGIESKEFYDKLRDLNVNIILGNHESYMIKEIRNDLNKLIKENKYDVVHCNTGGVELTAVTMMLSWIHRVPIRIAHSHNQKFDRFPYSKKELLYQIINGRLATTRLACARGAAYHLFGKNLGSKCLILKNGIECQKYVYSQKVRRDIREKLGKPDSLIIGHVGRFEEQKNHEFLIDIFYSIKQKRNDAILVLIGNGSLMTHIKEKVKQLGIDESVYFIGTTDRVQDYLQAMDVFVLPSITEGLPIVTVEVQAADLLTVCSDIVPKEAKFTNKMHFCSLEKNAEQWCDMILNEIEHTDCDNRKDRSREVTENGFNIKNSALELYRIYMGGV
jgi:glycosyltransferase involved in cell wall biosynthesis